MGYTLSPKGGEDHAMEGEFCYGRTNAFRNPVEGRRNDGIPLPGVWHLAKDRLQNLRALRAMWSGRAYGSDAAAIPLCQSVAGTGGGRDRGGEEGEAPLG